MQFKFIGDPNSDDNPEGVIYTSRLGQMYDFDLNGKAVTVDDATAQELAGNSHFAVAAKAPPAPKKAPAKKKAAKKKAKKKAKKTK